jgi:hypothetical protein
VQKERNLQKQKISTPLFKFPNNIFSTLFAKLCGKNKKKELIEKIENQNDQIQNLKQELKLKYKFVEEQEIKNRCAICFENPKTFMFPKCKHICVCKSCSKKVPKDSTGYKCYICRQNNESLVEVFY